MQVTHVLCLATISWVSSALAAPQELTEQLERLASLSRVKRVIGGDVIAEGEHPHLALLTGKVPHKMAFWGKIPYDYHKYYCGGAIIDSRWVLTAAHCFKQDKYIKRVQTPKYWHIKAGETESDTDLSDKVVSWIAELVGNSGLRVWEVHAKKIFIHPKYDEKDTWKNDLALVKLEESLPVETDEHIDTVSLPSEQDSAFPADGDVCVMTGWGCTQSSGKLSEDAHAAELPKVNDGKCSSLYGVDTEHRMCAGKHSAGIGICRGDSGGPLVCQRGSSWYLSGIASFTSANKPGDYPGVFTRVDQYLDWIQKTMKNN